MIRVATDTGWHLINHRDHAALAGEFASSWGNTDFYPPQPFADVHYAVAHHDDGWIVRDASPVLTKDRKPEAFTRALVGAYSAFEEIDLPNYLRVRKEATESVAAANAYAGILVSMHTVNLLTEQADVSTIRQEHLGLYHAFIASQRSWQAETAARLRASSSELQLGFEFLQCCDSLSLIVCSDYQTECNLRHTHPDRAGARHRLRAIPQGERRWQISPWPFAKAEHVFRVPYKSVSLEACAHESTFQAAFTQSPLHFAQVTLVP